MRPEQRVAVSIPLTELWDAAGPVAATRGRRVGVPEIAALLRNGPVRFIVADAGPLRWIAADQTHAFWKPEAKPHLVSAHMDTYRLDDFPGGFCYVATEWERGDPGDSALVLLERLH